MAVDSPPISLTCLFVYPMTIFPYFPPLFPLYSGMVHSLYIYSFLPSEERKNRCRFKRQAVTARCASTTVGADAGAGGGSGDHRFPSLQSD